MERTMNASKRLLWASAACLTLCGADSVYAGKISEAAVMPGKSLAYNSSVCRQNYYLCQANAHGYCGWNPFCNGWSWATGTTNQMLSICDSNLQSCLNSLQAQ